jgi:hypothetical protein
LMSIPVLKTWGILFFSYGCKEAASQVRFQPGVFFVFQSLLV